MANYSYTNAINLSSPTGVQLNGSYVKFDDLPESVKILISNPKYVVLVRENTVNISGPRGRTSGTMWHNKQILGFTVEDAIREVTKIAGQTAIPDVIDDPNKFNGVPPTLYTIRLTSPSSEFITKTFYKGKGMVIESISAKPGSRWILESDVFVPQTFETDPKANPTGVAFSGCFIHQGTSEGSSAGCIIFSRTRNANNTIKEDVDGVQKLNKYLLETTQLIGPGKSQQFIIINLWELPPPPPTVTAVGTVIDSETNQPIEGIKIQQISNTPTSSITSSSQPPTQDVGSLQTLPLTPLDTNTPTPQNVQSPEVGSLQTRPLTPLTTSQGQFEIEIPSSIPSTEEPSIPVNTNLTQPITPTPTTETIPQPEVSSTPPPTETEPPKIIVSAPGYEPVEVVPYKGDGTAKSDLGVILLTPTSVALEQDKIKASQLTQDQTKEISKGDKGADYYSQERLSNQITNVKSTLIPSILTLIAIFGITKASELAAQNPLQILDTIQNQSTCPTQQELASIISKKNKLVKQLNSILKLIDNTTKALGIAGGVIEGLNIAFNILKNIQIPTSTPGLLTGVVLAIQDNKDRIDKLIGKLRNINLGVLATLVLLRQVLVQTVQLLNLLDQLVQNCYPEAEQSQLSEELIALTQQQSQQQSPVVTNVNGFEMGVETEITENPLKRRRAIARNKKGIVMLKGEWSFSSIDQILIDELVFYIQINELKAD